MAGAVVALLAVVVGVQLTVGNETKNAPGGHQCHANN
jgi:hypothetical protein